MEWLFLRAHELLYLCKNQTKIPHFLVWLSNTTLSILYEWTSLMRDPSLPLIFTTGCLASPEFGHAAGLVFHEDYLKGHLEWLLIKANSDSADGRPGLRVCISNYNPVVTGLHTNVRCSGTSLTHSSEQSFASSVRHYYLPCNIKMGVREHVPSS